LACGKCNTNRWIGDNCCTSRVPCRLVGFVPVNQLESLLEEAHIKLSSFVSDLLGFGARRMLKALAEGETNPAALAPLADERLRATPEQLCDALGACRELSDVYRRLLQMALEECRLIDEQIGKLDQELASLLSQHQDAVERLAEVPGLGVDSAQLLLKSARPPLPFPPGNVSRPGSVLAREKKRAPA